MRVLLNWRYYVLLLLGLIATVGIFGTPADDCPTWLLILIVSKIIGFGAAYYYYRLMIYWCNKGRTPELEKLNRILGDDEV